MPAPQSIVDLPERTKLRTDKYREAGYLYIHHGERDVGELAKRTGCNQQRLYIVRREDKWDEYVDTLRVKAARQANDSDTTEATWTEEDLALISQELKQRASVTLLLQRQRDAMMLKLTKLDPTNSKYTQLLTNLDKLTQLAGRYVLLDDWLAEAAELRKAKRGKKGGGDMPRRDDKPASNTMLLPEAEASTEVMCVDEERLA